MKTASETAYCMREVGMEQFGQIDLERSDFVFVQ